MGKQKSPSDALSLQWYYKQFEMGKQKSPSGLPLGLFWFPKIIQTINDLIFISWWVININTGNEYFLKLINDGLPNQIQLLLIDYYQIWLLIIDISLILQNHYYIIRLATIP